MAVGRAQWESGEIDGTWRKKVGQRDGQGERDGRGKKAIAEGKKLRKKGKSEGTGERVMAEGKGPNHQGKNKRDGRRERAMVKKIELKREELEGAPITNKSLQPKKLKYNVQRGNYKKKL